MKTRIIALLMALALTVSFAGCSAEPTETTSDVEVIVETIVDDQTSSEEDNTVSSENNVSSENVSQNSSIEAPVSSETPSASSSEVSSTVTSTPVVDELVNIDYEWKSHPEDYKLIAFTFDDGPTGRVQDYVNLFADFDGAATFFINGRNLKSSYEYGLLQNAINYGWDIGNHGENHLVATIGGEGGKEATYEELKNDIVTLNRKLETNLVKRDGTPYEVTSYRAPNIKPTANTFKLCNEFKYPVIWLAYDALDWDTTKTDKNREDVFKYGVGKWEDGDVILCHEVQQYADQTYEYIERYLPEFFRKGYRFCSISELMELRGITRDQICGELNNVDGNRGMVTNIVKAAQQGKKK
ncbi:MAG: polysaccharide deacetylase family protein [Clostridia bacterium]|nr:polysaccharide deacetylase family protein [Clostridia bacterium]